MVVPQVAGLIPCDDDVALGGWLVVSYFSGVFI